MMPCTLSSSKMTLAPFALALLMLLHFPSAAKSAQCSYTISIKTTCGNIFAGSGTDGEVNVRVADSWSQSSGEPTGTFAYFDDLNNPGNDFERCSLDKYTRTDQECINFCSMKLSLRADGLNEVGAAWQVDYVQVEGNGLSKTFQVNRWLSPTRTFAGEPQYASASVNLC